jgi:superoxide oxidase
MAIDNSKYRYGTIARSLHWLVAALVIATVTIAELRGYTVRGSDLRKLASNAHYQIGIGIFILGWIWLGWRIRQVQPSITPPIPWWQRRVADVEEWIFYAMLIVLPILGLLAQQTEGHPVVFLGLTLPTLAATNDVIQHRIEDLHVLLGNVMLWLVGLHIAAALYHALISGDNTLARIAGDWAKVRRPTEGPPAKPRV